MNTFRIPPSDRTAPPITDPPVQAVSIPATLATPRPSMPLGTLVDGLSGAAPVALAGLVPPPPPHVRVVGQGASEPINS